MHRGNMITRVNRDGEHLDGITLEKRIGDRDVSSLGAFGGGETLALILKMPREVGASGAVLRMRRDGGEAHDTAFEISQMGLFEEYRAEILLTEGLWFYEILILRGLETLFSSTENNSDISFSLNEGNEFTLLVHDGEYKAPKGFDGGVMYHIFVDRFKKSDSIDLPKRDDAEYESDWYEGRLQYAQTRGGEVKNNRFFGGDLYGIAEKLPYLESLGVTTLYISPVFEAYSNHKYDTGNYMKVDEGFGGDAALKNLIEKAHERGIKIILDGVFNHTGDDSLYFDKKGKYGGVGAYKNPESPFRDWFNFVTKDDGSVGYESWWGIEIMPRLNQNNAKCREYFTGDGGVCERYMKMGVDGFRLDVADELSDEFLYEFRDKMRAEKPESILIGEVWENAVTKVAYGERRHYFDGRQLDSVMNYPFRTALIEAFRYSDPEILAHTLTMLYSTYPREVSNNLMNIIGTHDTERILTLLAGANGDGMTNAEADAFSLRREERRQGIEKLMAASLIQYTVYGFPSLYYGDEAGMEGLFDPFNRRPYPWGHESKTLLSHYKKLGALRKDPIFKGGDFEVISACGTAFVFERRKDERRITVAVNLSGDETKLHESLYGYDLINRKNAFVSVLGGYKFAVIENK